MTRNEHTCPDCRETKPVEDFPRDRAKAKGIRPYCKPCASRRTGAWAKANPEKHAAQSARYAALHPEKMQERYQRRNWRNAGITDMTPERYQSELLKQDGRCADCNGAVSYNLCVDHDHSTGLYRPGLVCHGCNQRRG